MIGSLQLTQRGEKRLEQAQAVIHFTQLQITHVLANQGLTQFENHQIVIWNQTKSEWGAF